MLADTVKERVSLSDSHIGRFEEIAAKFLFSCVDGSSVTCHHQIDWYFISCN